MKRILLIISIVLFVITAALPWVVYSYSLSCVKGRPTPSKSSLSADELNKVWVEYEKDLRKEDIGDITPYWFYKFLVYASANDSFGIQVTEKQMSAGRSHMASFVALWYLRDGNFKGKGMLEWHIAGTSLGIWLQRHWSPEQLAASYIVYKDRISNRSKDHNKM